MRDFHHAPTWRDWSIFGLQWLVLALLAGGVYLRFSPFGTDAAIQLLLPALVIGIIANLIVGLLLLVPALNSGLPIAIVIGDIVTAAAFVNIVEGDLTLTGGIVAALLFSTLMRLGSMWGAVHVIGVIGAAVAMLMISQGVQPVLTAFETTGYIPLLILGAMGVVALVGHIVQDNNSFNSPYKQVAGVKRDTLKEIESMRARTRAMYEISSNLGSAFSQEEIVNAALDVGRVFLGNDSGKRFVSLALFWRGDDRLYVGGSRGLMLGEENHAIRGVEGLVGKTIRDAETVRSDGSLRRDPELQNFASLDGLQSALCVPLQIGYNRFGCLLYAAEPPDLFGDDELEFLTAIGTQVTIALQNSVLYRELVQEKERILTTEEEARKRMARELHDGPTQIVSSAAMYLNVIGRTLEKQPSELPAQLEQIRKVENMSRDAAREMREFMSRWRPLTLESQGLNAALEHLSKMMRENHHQDVAIRVGRDVEDILDARQQGVIFAIAEEAVNNARKHAQAQLISVTVGRKNDLIIVQIADNGVGFDVDAVESNYSSRGSLGMVNLRERADLLEGNLHIESAKGQGTKITVVIPLKAHQLTASLKRATSELPKVDGQTGRLHMPANNKRQNNRRRRQASRPAS